MKFPAMFPAIPTLALASAVLCTLATGPAAHANLLTVNPGFEATSGFVGGPDPFVNSTAIPGWRLTGVGDGGTPGNFSQILGVTTDPATGKEGNNFAYNVRGVFETLDTARPAVVAGNDYQFAFIAEADFDNVATKALFAIDWYASNSGYAPLASTTQLITIQELGQFQSFSLTGTAPAGALFAAVRYDTTNASTNSGGANAWFDAASLTDVTPIPEPAALSLLGIAPLALKRRRRA